MVANETLSFFAAECERYEQTQSPPRLLFPVAPRLLFPVALRLWRGQGYKFLYVPMCWVITALTTAVLTRQGHLSVSCLTSSGAQLEMTHWGSPATVPCPRGLPARDPCRPSDALQRGRAPSICQAHQFGLNLGHSSMTHSAKNAKALPLASLQPASIPPRLHFPGWKAHPPGVAERN